MRIRVSGVGTLSGDYCAGFNPNQTPKPLSTPGRIPLPRVHLTPILSASLPNHPTLWSTRAYGQQHIELNLSLLNPKLAHQVLDHASSQLLLPDIIAQIKLATGLQKSTQFIRGVSKIQLN